MADYYLPEVQKGTKLELLHFPTTMQCFVFRNWEMVDKSRIAKVLKISTEKVEKIASDMGLPPQSDLTQWATRGYITIIKQNWHIIPYSQLLELLDWNEEHLAYVLREDDFLSIKLGDFKFDCPPVKYEELTDEQKIETAEIAKTVKEVWGKKTSPPFNFFSKNTNTLEAKSNIEGVLLSDDWGIKDESGFARTAHYTKIFQNEILSDWNIKLSGNKKFITLKKATLSGSEESHNIEATQEGITISANSDIGILRGLMFLCDEMRSVSSPTVSLGVRERHAQFKTRMIYSFHGLYGNVFDEPPEASLSEEMLLEYARVGVNGIWMPAVLRNLVEFPFDPEFSKGYEKRQENLKKMVELAADYGIKIYLYLNEPRSMPLSFFEKHPELMGEKEKTTAALCTSLPQVQKYLYDSVVTLCTVAKGIGGFFTITASEKFTNCYSMSWEGRKTVTCPHCKDRTPAQVFAEVNNIIADAAKSVDKNIRVVAWSWAWKNMEGFSEDECINLISKDVTLMAKSEEDLQYTFDGDSYTVGDYTMSLPAPSEAAKSFWQKAKNTGHNIMAKVQINNTWECSVVPYIPVFGLVSQHIERLANTGVNNLMLSWTLGGSPSPNIKIASRYFFDDKKPLDMFSILYKEEAKTIKEAVELLDQAFREFPFHIRVIYKGPHFIGPVNLLYKNKTGFSATMTGYPYDDIDLWRGPFTREFFKKQLFLLSSKWKKGLDRMDSLVGTELYGITETCYDIFRSCYNQVCYLELQEQGKYKEMIKILQEEEKLAINMYKHALCNAQLGYEAANHYVYTPQMCLEKVLNCRKLIKEFKNM